MFKWQKKAPINRTILYISQATGGYSDTNLVITGDLLIVMGQIITASQMVYEEKFIYKYNVPSLQAVGWEGECLTVYLNEIILRILICSSHGPYCCNCVLNIIFRSLET